MYRTYCTRRKSTCPPLPPFNYSLSVVFQAQPQHLGSPLRCDVLYCAVLPMAATELLIAPPSIHSRSPSFSPKEPLLSLLLERPQKNKCYPPTHPCFDAVVYVQYTMLAPVALPPQKIRMSASQMLVLCYLFSLIAVLRLFF